MQYSFKICEVLLPHDITGSEMLSIRRELRARIEHAKTLLKQHQVDFAEPRTDSEFGFGHEEVWAVYIDFYNAEDYAMARLLLDHAVTEL